MNENAFISICIPAYKRIADLKRLLDSIAIQSFKSFEVIITDDSPDDSVKEICVNYKHVFKLIYYKNSIPVGTPENWNEAIRKANGEWIKLMHDDDYFASSESLQSFVTAIHTHPNTSLFYSAFAYVDDTHGIHKTVRCEWYNRFLLGTSYYYLLRRNYFGNPSCIIFKKNIPYLYDSRLKFIVDYAYYLTLLSNHITYQYIPHTLIHVGLNDQQVTHYTFKNKQIQLYENHVLLAQLGEKALKNIIVFDYFWRLYRNFNVRSKEDITIYYNDTISPVLIKMIEAQKKIPSNILRWGIISKFFMIIYYCRSRWIK
mgnify:CR=1 FL=1